MPISIPERSVDVLTLERLLESVNPGEMIEYSVLSAAVGGRDIQYRERHVLDAARCRLIRREPPNIRMVFGAVMGKGLKRLDSVGCLSLGDQTIRSIRRSSNRGALKVACAAYDELATEDKIRFNAHLAHLGAINLMSKPAAVRRIQQAVATSNTSLVTTEVLALFCK
jgi:hypothetical protein